MVVTDSTRNASAVRLETRIPPPTATGPHRTGVAVYRYPAVLPAGWQRSLHRLHPAAAASASVSVLFAPLVVLYLLLVDGAAPIRMEGSRRRPRRGPP
jgi:hypothetical protein